MTVTDARTPTRGPWTYERLSARTGVDNVRREIIDGWLYIDGQQVDDPYADVAADSARVPHGDAVRELLAALLEYRREHDGQVYTAPMDVSFSSQTLQPDVFWLPHAPPPDQLPIQVLPMLVVEVSSPSTRSHDLLRKRRVYEQSGVPEYWFVDLDADRVERYALDAATYGTPELVPRGGTVVSAALKGFEVLVDDVLGPGARTVPGG